MDWTSLISIEWYIDSVRYLWLTTTDAIKEIIDNSIDAKALNIFISIYKDWNKTNITIEDDGDWIKKDRISSILSFWWRNYVDVNTVWKFWWWLPSAVCCQTTRAELYSKVNWDSFYYSYIDLEEFKNNWWLIPVAIKKDPSEFVLNTITNKWTFICFKDCDNLDYKTISKIEDRILLDMGETYRVYINNWLNIYVNNKKIEIYDPLLQIEWSVLVKDFWKSKILDELNPIIFEDIIDPITSKPAQINVKLALMDFEKIKSLENYRSKVKDVFNIDNQWFYLMRNNRQIWGALPLLIFKKHNDFNYFRWEISFPPCLDKFFGVHTNKSRFTIKPEIKEKIDDLTRNLIGQIRKLSKRFVLENLSNGDKNIWGNKIELIISELDKELSKKKNISLDKKSIAEADKAKEIKINSINSNSNLSDQQKEKEITKIEEEYKLPFKFELEARWKSNAFYELRAFWYQSIIVINTEHPFYEKVYLVLLKEHLESCLQLLIYTLAKSEQNIIWEHDKEEFYNDEKMEWSKIIRKILTTKHYDEVDYDISGYDE